MESLGNKFSILIIKFKLIVDTIENLGGCAQFLSSPCNNYLQYFIVDNLTRNLKIIIIINSA